MEHAAREALERLQTANGLSWSSGRNRRLTIALSDVRARALVPVLAAAAELRLQSADNAKAADDTGLFEALTETWQETSAEQPQVPVTDTEPPSNPKTTPVAWLLEKVECNAFGGISGPAATGSFVLEVSPESTCLHGGNGSGKTSLISAIAWALTGQRIDDAVGLSFSANRPAPVFDKSDPNKQIGSWPPVATYPSTQSGYTASPTTTVSVTFKNADTEQRATVTRTYSSQADGFSVVQWDKELEPLRACIDVAVEMPLRIAHLRLGQESHLNDLIAALTGLELLGGIGDLVATLARIDRPFLNTPKKVDHDATKFQVTEHLDRAIAAAESLRTSLLPFRKLEDLLDSGRGPETQLLQIAARLTKSAADDLKALADYVAPSIDIKTSTGQTSLANAIAAAASTYNIEHITALLPSTCGRLSELSRHSPAAQTNAKELTEAADKAAANLRHLIVLHRRRLSDRRLALKALAAETHRELHGDSPIDACPLCDRPFDAKRLRELGDDIGRLAAEASVLRGTLAANCKEIVDDLDSVTRTHLSMPVSAIDNFDPVVAIGKELRSALVSSHAFSSTLPSLGKLFDENIAVAAIPAFASILVPVGLDAPDLPPADQSLLQGVANAICSTRRAAEILLWCEVGAPAFLEFLTILVGTKPSADSEMNLRTLCGLCAFLSQAASQAQPAQIAGTEIQSAATKAGTWILNERQIRTRTEIIKAIEPLKQLPKYVEASVDAQLADLSTRIADFVERFHLSAPLAFQRARLEREPRKRKGFLRARAAPKANIDIGGLAAGNLDYEIDAGLIANTSWMRALLWAFLLALREKRAEQQGGMVLPLMLMDDPQATFDAEHRCAWIEILLAKQNPGEKRTPIQAVLTTHDPSFANSIELQIPGFPIRHITGRLSESESIFVYGSTIADRLFRQASISKTNETSSNAIAELRKYLEDLVRAIVPAAMAIKATTLGELMSELRGKSNDQTFPYVGTEFARLCNAWEEPSKEKCRKALSETHHTSTHPYDYVFAREVFAWFEKGLKGPLRAAFDRIWRVREAGWKTPHGGFAFVSAAHTDVLVQTQIALPANLNRIMGRVAAETDGQQVRIIDGQPALRFVAQTTEMLSIGTIQAVVLAAATLEPAAQIGDVLLLSQTMPPTENCLVVCHADGAWRARRYGILGSSSTAAVLSASATNPRTTRPPILIGSDANGFRKVVGILYRQDWKLPPIGDDEASPVETIGVIEATLARAEGCAVVVGESAEPIALDRQHLILGKMLREVSELHRHDGQPIVADKAGRILFKRLRLTHRNGPIVLESLDSAGRYPPVVIDAGEAAELGERLTFRPVLGVLFDTTARKH